MLVWLCGELSAWCRIPYRAELAKEVEEVFGADVVGEVLDEEGPARALEGSTWASGAGVPWPTGSPADRVCQHFDSCLAGWGIGVEVDDGCAWMSRDRVMQCSKAMLSPAGWEEGCRCGGIDRPSAWDFASATGAAEVCPCLQAPTPPHDTGSAGRLELVMHSRLVLWGLC